MNNYLSICIYVQCTYIIIFLSICLSIYLSIDFLSIYWFIYKSSIYLSSLSIFIIYLSIYEFYLSLFLDQRQVYIRINCQTFTRHKKPFYQSINLPIYQSINPLLAANQPFKQHNINIRHISIFKSVYCKFDTCLHAN